MVKYEAEKGILQLALKDYHSSKHICADVSLLFLLQKLSKFLHSSWSLSRLKMKSGQKIHLRHKQMPLQSYKKCMTMGDYWKKVIFSDDKRCDERCNLDNLEGLKYYWRELYPNLHLPEILAVEI